MESVSHTAILNKRVVTMHDPHRVRGVWYVACQDIHTGEWFVNIPVNSLQKPTGCECNGVEKCAACDGGAKSNDSEIPF